MFQQFLQQLKTGLKVAQEVIPLNPSAYSRIIFCGMGGSIMPAEAVSMLWLNDINGYINRASHLPQWTSSEHAVVCVSWSGDTEETISAYKSAKERNIPVYAITSGGILAELAQKDQIPFVLLPNSGLAPRDAFGLMFSSLLTLLSHSDIIENNLSSSIFSGSEPGTLAEKLAGSIGKKTPLLYSSYPWRYLENFWKKFFNENCKKHSFCNFIPEAVHNEIAGVKKNDSEFFYLILKDSEEEKDDLAKLNKLEKFLQSYGASFFVSEIKGSNRFEKIISQYVMASQTSLALAEKLGIDPDDISIIEDFKKNS